MERLWEQCVLFLSPAVRFCRTDSLLGPNEIALALGKFCLTTYAFSLEGFNDQRECLSIPSPISQRVQRYG